MRFDDHFPPYAWTIHHDGSSLYVRFAHDKGADLGDEVGIRIRTGPDAPIDRILLRTCPDGEQSFTEMKPGPSGPACRWWTGTLKLLMPTVHYRFLIFSKDGAFWFNGSGLHRHTPTDADDFRILAGYNAPRWVRDTVFYQIFPDRFCDGDRSSNVKNGAFTNRGHPAQARAWGTPPTTKGPNAMVEFYGGDLAGIQQRLDYLVQLGVNAIYLNPIFTAYSNHRYDVVDYFNVDPHLGGNEALANLRRATNERGMRFILDIVPNHCGSDHPWFREAQKDLLADTAGYFTFSRHPDEYLCWLGVRSLPKLNYANQQLRSRMYSGDPSVFRQWLRPPYSIDGWRIDVANMLARQGADQLGLEVAEGIRWAVKEENPEAYLLGENFFDPTAQLQGTCWDAVMNYAGFAQPLWHWLGGFGVQAHGLPGRVESPIRWSTFSLDSTLRAYRASIPWIMARQQFNLIGSHDTARIATVVKEDPGLCQLAAGLLITYLGVPCVYYGDELGMTGANGDAARACMPTDTAGIAPELFSFYQRLIQLKRTAPALIEGGFQTLQVEADTLVYLRDAPDDLLVVVAHRGPGIRPAGSIQVAHGAIPDGCTFQDISSAAQATVRGGHLEIPSMKPGLSIWRAHCGSVRDSLR